MGNMKSLNPLNLIFPTNQDKIIRNTFMPKINREPKDKKFVKISKYMTQHIFRFFDYNELRYMN